MSETLGDRLRRLRLERGLSQRDLSGPGISYAYISRVEAGARRPSVRALRKLAPKLGVTVEYLETGRNESLVDELVTQMYELGVRSVAIMAFPDGADIRADVRWTIDVDGEETPLHDPGESITDALLAAVSRVRERAEILAEQERLAERERSLRS